MACPRTSRGSARATWSSPTTTSRAAGYALATADPRWHRVIREALRIRVGGAPLYRNPWRRRADLVGSVSSCLDPA